ncbi:hypothetical protein KIH39_21505 [Telmatocola sphagniphila]|uniref:Uncharacterized protein n=1 Tax=Telmatocola sphagniphila TaxID=1123043 RepID=A0A8E6B4W0_9BACT|nr:hypothetical protein [Telmatocola sphagniphila]QVL31397.1 hypothetical protein KIH39_21505 [Telmatocola sphagniphila]
MKRFLVGVMAGCLGVTANAADPVGTASVNGSGQAPATISAPAPAPTAPAPMITSVTPTAPTASIMSGAPAIPTTQLMGDSSSRGFLESDHAFDNFVGPSSNPVLSKDPRSLTEARILFIDNNIPNSNPLGGGNFQVYAMQIRLALTDRLTLIADKDGIASISAKGAPHETGFLNLAAGLKYTFYRDVENQTLAAAGFMFEPQTGESKVFQGQGDGIFTFFATYGQEFWCKNHIIVNGGYIVPVDSNQNSSLFYTQLHLDRQVNEWLYPLMEVNWYHWLAGGNRGLPPALGEGDGLLNLGTSGVAGNDLVSMALGFKVKISPHAETGVVYEFPLTSRKDLLDSRIQAELILRY